MQSGWFFQVPPCLLPRPVPAPAQSLGAREGGASNRGSRVGPQLALRTEPTEGLRGLSLTRHPEILEGGGGAMLQLQLQTGWSRVPSHFCPTGLCALTRDGSYCPPPPARKLESEGLGSPNFSLLSPFHRLLWVCVEGGGGQAPASQTRAPAGSLISGCLLSGCPIPHEYTVLYRGREVAPKAGCCSRE